MIAFWTGIAFAARVVAWTPQLSLDQAIEIAEANAFSLKIADSAIAQTQEGIDEAKASGLPQVAAGATYSRFDQPPGGGGQRPTPKESKLAELTVSFPIDISGNIRRGIRVASLIEESTRLNRKAVQLELRNQVRRSFFQVLQAEELVQLAERSLQLSRERLVNTEKAFEAGTLPKVEVLRAQTLVSLGETEVTAALNRRTLAKQTLNNVMGRAIQTAVEPVSPQESWTTEAPAETLLGLAWKTRPDVLSLQLRQETLKIAREAERRGLQPSLVAGARHQRDWGDLTSTGRSNTSGTLSLSVPLLDSGITRARVRQAVEDEKQNQIQLDQLRLGVQLQIESALSSLNDARSRLISATRSAELAEETLRLEEIRFREEVAIQLEVSNAQTSLVQARTNLIQARVDYWIAWADLQRAIGADDLGGLARPLELPR
ncbi:MAG TPA: TolC family protein [Fimbriimonadaceae bacterium]|nr:TolC family protein [Fimbriimonadaceae bacterium]HRJ32251.1 TolC family protein [Fimbriimonadaceae bacterium]